MSDGGKAANEDPYRRALDSVANDMALILIKRRFKSSDAATACTRALAVRNEDDKADDMAAIIAAGEVELEYAIGRSGRQVRPCQLLSRARAARAVGPKRLTAPPPPPCFSSPWGQVLYQAAGARRIMNDPSLCIDPARAIRQDAADRLASALLKHYFKTNDVGEASQKALKRSGPEREKDFGAMCDAARSEVASAISRIVRKHRSAVCGC